jgi:hypothetical protein
MRMAGSEVEADMVRRSKTTVNVQGHHSPVRNCAPEDASARAQARNDEIKKAGIVPGLSLVVDGRII